MVNINKLRLMNLGEVADELEALRLQTRNWPAAPTPEMYSAVRKIALHAPGVRGECFLEEFEIEKIYAALRAATEAGPGVTWGSNPYTSGVNCKSCGEQMEGDGYNTVLHCPNASEETWWDHEPDANPVECFCYPGSGQTDSPARITERDVVEILESFWRSTDDREDWVKGEDGQSLLNRLNQDHEQVPAVAKLAAMEAELAELRAYKEAAENRSMAWLANALEQYANGDVITVPAGAGTEEEFFPWLKDQCRDSSTAGAVTEDISAMIDKVRKWGVELTGNERYKIALKKGDECCFVAEGNTGGTWTDWKDLGDLLSELAELRAYKEAAESQEPIYQKRHLDERWWEDTDKNNFDVCASLQHIETRKVFLCPVPADKPTAAVPDFETWWRALPSYRDADKPAAKMAWDYLAELIAAAPSHSQQSAKYAAFVEEVREARRLWMDMYPPEDGHDCVTPFDQFIYTDRCPSHERDQVPAVAVPDDVKAAIDRLDTTAYRQWARENPKRGGYIAGNINTVHLVKVIEWVRNISAAPSPSQQSARTCDDAVLHALEKAQPFVEMARESGIAGAREAEILMANVYDTVRDRCPSHESEQGGNNDV